MSTESRRGVFSRIGGHPALDLVNTVEWRLSSQRFEDDLGDYHDVLRWAEQLALIPAETRDALDDLAAADPAVADAEFERVRQLREALYGTLFSGGDPGILVEEYTLAVAAGRLVRTDSAWACELPADLTLPRRRIALAAFDLLTRSDLTELAQCQDAECGWVFLDTSPQHNRRWCVAADCGNRNRAREFYRRSRAARGE